MTQDRRTRSTGGQSKLRFCGRAMPVQSQVSLHLTGLHGTAVTANSTCAIGAVGNCTALNGSCPHDRM